MQLRMEFEEKIADIKPSIATLDQAMDEVLLCGELTELFHVALITGNIINGVCKWGGAGGVVSSFTLRSSQETLMGMHGAGQEVWSALSRGAHHRKH
jgi:hypothetical protein